MVIDVNSIDDAAVTGNTFRSPIVNSGNGLFNFQLEKNLIPELVKRARKDEERSRKIREEEREFAQEKRVELIQRTWNGLYKDYEQGKNAPSLSKILDNFEGFSASVSSIEEKLYLFFVISCKGNKKSDTRRWEGIITSVHDQLSDFYNEHYTKERLFFSDYPINISNTDLKIGGFRKYLHKVFEKLPCLIFGIDVNYDPIRSNKDHSLYQLKISYSVGELGIANVTKTEYIINEIIDIPINDEELATNKFLKENQRFFAKVQMVIGCAYDIFNIYVYKKAPLYPGILLKDKDNSVYSNDEYRHELVEHYKDLYAYINGFKGLLNLKEDRIYFDELNELLLRYAHALSEFLGEENTNQWCWDIFVDYLQFYTQHDPDDAYLTNFRECSQALYYQIHSEETDDLEVLINFVWSEIVKPGPGHFIEDDKLKDELADLYFCLGCFYYYHYDKPKIEEYFTWSDYFDHCYAAYNLGLIYLQKDPQMARSYIERAQNRGCTEAEELLQTLGGTL